VRVILLAVLFTLPLFRCALRISDRKNLFYIIRKRFITLLKHHLLTGLFFLSLSLSFSLSLSLFYHISQSSFHRDGFPRTLAKKKRPALRILIAAL